MAGSTLRDPYAAEAERLAAGRAGDPAWVKRARVEALERFDRLGFPTTRDEDWRFTNVAAIAEGEFVLPRNGASRLTRADLTRFEWAGPRAATLVFVNGRYAEGLSRVGDLPAGVRVESLARAIAEGRTEVERHLGHAADGERHAFTALNTAFLADGAFVHVPEAAVVEAPVHLVFLAGGDEPVPGMAHPRVLVVMGATSQATIVETHAAAGPDRYLTNAVTEVLAGEGATVHHYHVQRGNAAGLHVASLYLRASRDATLFCHSATLGGALVRNNVNVVLDGEGAGCTLNGLYLSDGIGLVDNHTVIDHARPHCASRELYSGVLAGNGRAVFNGRIVVRPDAQKTDAKQTSKALLLSEDAQINAKPELEIFANDVKCTHGAAVGQIDDEAIFYLRARGIGEQDARHMLVRAFAAGVLSQMPLAALRTRLDEDLLARLPGTSLPARGARPERGEA
ncbi:MAG: Fe-S cluster assembly protein SufD [Betaproteobacteria bacterium]